MSGFSGADDNIDPVQPYVAPFQTWESAILAKERAEQGLATAFKDLVYKYRAKCEECDREKRNAVVWEKEQRLAERELEHLRSFAVSYPFLSNLIAIAPPFGCLSMSARPAHDDRLGILSVCICHYRRRWCRLS